MRIRAIVHIENGIVKTKIELPDGKYVADIITTDTRSNQQNRYYHGLVIPVLQHGFKEMGTEVSKQEVHEFLKAKFNYKELINRDTGEYEHIPTSTTRMNKGEFKEFIEKIQRFAAEFLNIEIPDPNTQTELSFSK